jgi:hypothetical protein
MILVPKRVETLHQWVQHGNVLVGYLRGVSGFKPIERVMTDAILVLDVSAGMARCLDGDYKLGEPGTYTEHNVPLL